MSPKLRKIIVDGVTYHWRMRHPNGDGDGGIGLRVFEGRKIVVDSWMGGRPLAITPAFVAAQIRFAVNPIDFVRVGGDVVCECGKLMYDHPMDGPYYQGFQWLHRACDGRLVKL